MTRPGMELSRRRDSSLQRRAAQALADEAADAQLQRLVDDVAATGTSGATALSDVPGNTGMVSGVSGGDLLAGLQPIGPPMSFSPGDFLEPVRGETTKGEKNLEVKGENPEVKRVVVSEPSSDARRSDGADGNASGSPKMVTVKVKEAMLPRERETVGPNKLPRVQGVGRRKMSLVSQVGWTGMLLVKTLLKCGSPVMLWGKMKSQKMWCNMVVKNMLFMAKG